MQNIDIKSLLNKTKVFFKKGLFLFFMGFILSSCSQNNIADVLNKYNDGSVPYIEISEAKDIQSEIIFLDTREKAEYEVSHIKNAIHVGFNRFDLEKTLSELNNSSKTIVVYCSIGVRSEDIGEKLEEAGIAKVYNLQGGIFEWKNNGLPVYNSKEKATDKVHAYSKKWSKWLLKGTKVYE